MSMLGADQRSLDGLTDQAWDSIRTRLTEGSLEEFGRAASRVGFCERPIRLVGESFTADAVTGEVLSSFSSEQTPLGVLLTRCGNRRESACASCSRVYARDVFEMVRCGVHGGKGVPEQVKENPLVFVTVTAPSFGAVHSTRGGNVCHPRGAVVCRHGRSKTCAERHEVGDSVIGSPICDDCYDYLGHVVWQFHAPELWRRAIQDVNRQLAVRLGVGSSSVGKVASRQYGRTAEMQARGAVHFHALFRLDGPSDEGIGAVCTVEARTLVDAIRAAFARVAYTAPPTFESDDSRVLRWGSQVDVRVVHDGVRTDDPDGPITGEQVAAYLAKYSTKDTSLSVPDSAHGHRLVQTCRDLHEVAVLRTAWRRGGIGTVVPVDAQGVDHYILMGKWAKELGYRGHYASKSRQYSVTFKTLRRRRARFQQVMRDESAKAERAGKPLHLEDVERALQIEDAEEEAVLTVTTFEFVAGGWPEPGDAEIARAASARAREYAKAKANGAVRQSN